MISENIKDYIFDVMKNKYLGSKVIFLTHTGSILHGTDTVFSDIDIRGIYMPSINDMILEQAESHILLELDSNKTDVGKKVEITLVSIQEFLRKLINMECNTVEMLFAFNSSKIIYKSSEMITVFQQKDKFLNHNYDSFFGMANSEIKRIQRSANRVSPEKDLAHGIRTINTAVELYNTNNIEYPIHNNEYYRDIKLRKKGNVADLFLELSELINTASKYIHKSTNVNIQCLIENKNQLILELYRRS